MTLAACLVVALQACDGGHTTATAASGAGAQAGSHTGADSASATSPPAARELPPLPGVAPGEREWFWRDVLSAAFPGETTPDLALLAIPSDTERLDALSDLAPAHDPRALNTLMAALRDKRVGVAAAAAHDLGAYGFKAAIPRLLKGIGPWPVDYDVPVQERAAQCTALAQLGNPAGMPLMLMILAEGTALETPDAELPWTRTPQMAFAQDLVLPGLRALTGQDFGFRVGAPVPVREQAVREATAWWQQHRVALWNAAPLDDPGLEARVRTLVSHLPAYQLRQIDGARFTLANLGPAVLPFLIEGLASPDTYVRLHCLEVMERLADVADDKLRARLASVAADPLLNDREGGVASQAARVAGAAGVADQLIVAARRRTEPDVLLAIIDALGQSGRPEARDELLALQGSLSAAALPDLHVAVEASLLQLDCNRDPAGLLAFLASPDLDTAAAALQRLIALTHSDCSLDPMAVPEQRTAALAKARDALLRRCAH